MLRWTPTRGAATPSLPPTGQLPLAPPEAPIRVSAGDILVFWNLALPSPFLFCKQKTAPLASAPPCLSPQVAGGPSGVHRELCCVLCCALRCDWEKQPESRDGGPLRVLCPTGTQESGPQGRATIGAEATQVLYTSPEYLTLLRVGTSHKFCLPGL